MNKIAVTSGTSIQKLAEQGEQEIFPVIDKATNRYLGFVRHEDVERYKTEVSTAGNLLSKCDPTGLTRKVYVDPDESAIYALRKIGQHKVDFLPLVDHNGIYTGTVDVTGLSELLENKIP